MTGRSQSEIGFAQLGLGSALNQYQLIVPPNQREYAWEAKEVKTLFQDYTREIGDGQTFYFLGTVVTIPKGDRVLEVVDGQQRLATTAILLAAIRDYLRTSEKDIADSIEQDFLSVFNRTTRSRVPRLQLNLDDNEFFRQLLFSGDASKPTATKASHRLIQEAYDEAVRHVRDIVRGYDIREHGTVLNRWVSFIEGIASVILLRVPNATNAYRMFETLNDRGKRVSQSDLVKNYLFGQSGSRLAEVQQRWAYMRGALETVEEEDGTIEFLRHALTVLRGFVRGPDVYDAVQKYARGEQPVVSFVCDLESLAYAFVAIQNPEHERWNSFSPSARQALEVLNLFNLKVMRPLLLAVVTRLDDREIEQALRLCVSLAVRLMISGRTRTGAVEEGLAQTGYALHSSDMPTIALIRQKLGSALISDGQFSNAFENATVSNSRLARYYLRSLESRAANQKEPWHIPNDDQTVINLEHVLPEKPGPDWEAFDEDQVRIYRNRIGNLVLIRAADNSVAKSEGFISKRQMYGNTPYELTRQLGELEEWTVQAIENRQKVLAALAVDTWPI